MPRVMWKRGPDSSRRGRGRFDGSRTASRRAGPGGGPPPVRAAVLGRALDELAEAVPPSSGAGEVADYIDRLFTYHQEHPSILRLLLWEALEYTGAPVPDEVSRTAHYQEKARSVGELGAFAGPDGKGLDPRAALLLFTGLVGWPLAVPQVTRMIMGDDAEAVDRVKRAAVAAAQAIAGQA